MDKRDEQGKLYKLSDEDLKHIRLVDDMIFKSIVYHRPEVAREIIKILLGKDPKIEKEVGQKEIPDLKKKNVVLDYYGEGKDASLYNLEAQASRKSDIPFRAIIYFRRLLGSDIDKGEDYDYGSNAYVFFLCAFDPYREGKPYYDVLFAKKKGKKGSIEKEWRVTLFNLTYKGDHPLSNLYLDLLETDYNKVRNPVIRKALAELIKPEIKRRNIKMSEWGERIYKQGKEEGAHETAVSNAQSLIKSGLSLEFISENIGLSLEELQAIAKGLSKKEA